MKPIKSNKELGTGLDSNCAKLHFTDSLTRPYALIERGRPIRELVG